MAPEGALTGPLHGVQAEAVVRPLGADRQAAFEEILGAHLAHIEAATRQA
ncbi:hypothetical protein ACGF8D_24235 [Streptomyces massasporeus]